MEGRRVTEGRRITREACLFGSQKEPNLRKKIQPAIVGGVSKKEGNQRKEKAGKLSATTYDEGREICVTEEGSGGQEKE